MGAVRSAPALIATASAVAFAVGVLLFASGAAARAAGNADFLGTWTSPNGSWTITSESPGGACVGTTGFGAGYKLIGCQVTGNHYVFVITCCGSYRSNNSGTINGNTLKGNFKDTARHDINYVATRKATGKLEIDWSMPERLTATTPTSEHWDISGGMPRVTDISPKDWTVDLFLTDGGSPTCPAGVTFDWTVTGGGATQTLPGTSCKVTAKVPDPQVQVRDVLIVGIGDSNGSGEGNPPFYYDRCNRSVASYQFQAALYVEQQDPHSSVTFIHTSCSGARIDHLYATPYAGTRPAIPPLHPQIEQLSALLDRVTPARKIAAVIMSIGVNDLAFGPVLEFCVRNGTASTPCQNLSAAPTLDSAKRITGFSLDKSGASPTLGSQLARLQATLAPRYAPLPAELAKPIGPSGGLGIAPKQVFITQYPDFTNSNTGTPCGPTGIARFDMSTWSWLGSNAGLLNHTITVAAATHGWTLAPVNMGAFAKSGYCATNSLFVGIASANYNDDAGGPFHPNADAHKIQAAEVEPELCRSLGLDSTCK